MKERLLKNIDLKVLAVLFSVILWLIVVNIDDPVKTVQFSEVEVNVQNADELKNKGEVYEIVDNSNIISVSISGRRSIVEEITKDNIVAVADFKRMDEMGEVPISVVSNKSNGDINEIRTDISRLKVNVEPLKKIQKVISIDVTGKPAEDYVLGNVTSDLNLVRIEGPESIIEDVAVAKAELDVEGVSSNVIASANIKLYDDDGKQINMSRVSMNINSVNITQEVLFTKIVGIEYVVEGKPDEGYIQTGDIEADLYEAKICGKKVVVDNIDEIRVEKGLLNIEGQKSDFFTEIDLDSCLPNGVNVIDENGKGKISVSVKIEKTAMRNISFGAEDVLIDNVPEGYMAELLVDGTAIKQGENLLKVTGLSEVVEGIDETQVKFTVDLNEYKEANNILTIPEGIIKVEGKLNLPENVNVIGNYKFQIKISKVE